MQIKNAVFCTLLQDMGKYNLTAEQAMVKCIAEGKISGGQAAPLIDFLKLSYALPTISDLINNMKIEGIIEPHTSK